MAPDNVVVLENNCAGGVAGVAGYFCIFLRFHFCFSESDTVLCGTISKSVNRSARHVVSQAAPVRQRQSAS